MTCEYCKHYAEYENTRLTPEQIRQIDKDFSVLAKELHDWKENGIKLPCKVGDTVYVLCECGMIPEQLDGTLYESDGSPGTATGYYCPYENNCPHECVECDNLFECDKFRQKSAVFEDTVKSITLENETINISTENCPVYSPIGYAVFLTKEEAEAKLKEMEGE